MIINIQQFDLQKAIESTDEKNLEELFTENIEGWICENVE